MAQPPRTIHQAAEAKLCRFRQLLPPPASFDGSLNDLFAQYILPNLPSPEAVERFHSLFVHHQQRRDALFLVRALDPALRRNIEIGRDGVRWKWTDNAPSWWVHAALFQEVVIAPDAFPRVIEGIPAHMFDVSRTAPPTASSAGWHVAHLFEVKGDSRLFTSWSRREVIERCARNIHPCNYVLLPKPEWQRYGADPRVIGVVAKLYSELYGAVWREFVALAGCSDRALPTVSGDVPYRYASAAPPIQGVRQTITDQPETSSGAVKYSASRLTFKRRVIEGLLPNQRFRVDTPHGTFEMTRADFEESFPQVVRSRSYLEGGIYHYPKPPRAADRFRVG